jgi:hypothetical protein
MKLLFCLFLFSAMAITGAAADITGKWSGTFTVLGPGGQPETPSSAMMVVKQTGSTLTGTGGPNENEQWPIQSGKVTGNIITVQVTSPEGAVYNLIMTVAGDEVAGDAVVTHDGQSQKARVEFKRIK